MAQEVCIGCVSALLSHVSVPAFQSTYTCLLACLATRLPVWLPACPHARLACVRVSSHLWSPARLPARVNLPGFLTRLPTCPLVWCMHRWVMTDIHDAITSLAAHGKELPSGLTQQIKDEVDRLVRVWGLAPMHA